MNNLDWNSSPVWEDAEIYYQLFYAKTIAVKTGCYKQRKKDLGNRRAVFGQSEDKIIAVLALDSITYHTQPLKRVYIEKYGKKEKRPLGMPTIRGRDMQGLQLLALKPVIKSLFCQYCHT